MLLYVSWRKRVLNLTEEKCSNFENCGNTFHSSKNDKISFEFCSIECKTYVIKLRKCDAIFESTQGLIRKDLLLD